MAATINRREARRLRLLSPIAALDNLWRHRALIYQFARREVEGRYRGSFLGLFWSFITPLVMLLIYTFVFGVVFQARWPQAQDDGLGGFAVVVFAGLITFTIFSECATRAPALIVGVPNYVKKVVFPLEVLPVAALGAALFHAAVSLPILLGAHLLLGGALHWTVVLLPLVLAPLLLLTLGLSWLLASLGVFIRDLGNLIGLAVQVVFFLTPIFYSVEAVPEPLRAILRLNPLATVVEHVRAVLLWGRQPDWGALAGSVVIAALVALLGYAWFMGTKKAFADVI